jgi:hypothetical protein
MMLGAGPVVPVGLRLTLERSAQARDLHLEILRGALGRVVAPQLLRERVHRHRLVGVNQEQCEQRALLASRETDRTRLIRDLQVAEDAEVHMSRALLTAFTVPLGSAAQVVLAA